MGFKFLHQLFALTVIVCSLSTLASTLESATPSGESIKKTELQWALCEDSASSFSRKTGFPLKASERRNLYYLETASLALSAKGSFLRIREEDRIFKSSAKINFKDDQQLPWSELRGKDSKCEWDRYGNFKKVGCSLNHETSALTDVLSKDQKSYFQDIIGFNSWSDLRLLGPAQDEEWVWQQNFLSAELTLEEVKADGFYSLELSARVKNEDAEHVQLQTQNWLNSNQINLCPVQRGKSEALIRALLAK